MKSPLKDNPLHNPAESLDKEIDKLINENATEYSFYNVVAIMLVFMEWWRWFYEVKPSPILYSIIAASLIPYCTYKVLKIRERIKRLRLGRDGEKVVGQYLETLRETSAKVFHDIPAKGFNLTHVVTAKSGIYVIETKT